MESYTKVKNEILEKIIAMRLTSAELKIVLLIIRKTSGFHKENDEISIVQFQKFTNLSNRGVLNSIERLKLMNIISLVSKGKSRFVSNCFTLNKNISAWRPMNRSSLVKFPTLTSEIPYKLLVKLSSHTKETLQKKVQKKDTFNFEWLKTSGETELQLEDEFKNYEIKKSVKNMIDWVVSVGKEQKYKNFKAFARIWLRKNISKGELKRTMPTFTPPIHEVDPDAKPRDMTKFNEIKANVLKKMTRLSN